METGRISEGADGSSGPFSSGSDNGESGQFLIENHIAYQGSENHPSLVPERGFSLRFSRDLRGWNRTAPKARKRPPKRVRKSRRKPPLQGPNTTACMIRPGSN